MKMSEHLGTGSVCVCVCVCVDPLISCEQFSSPCQESRASFEVYLRLAMQTLGWGAVPPGTNPSSTLMITL
jgi:hypothetical protein